MLPSHALTKIRIPFERALDFANKEKITEILYPLFVHDIGALLYHPSNPSQPRGGVGGGAAGALSAMNDRRRSDQQRYLAGPQAPQTPSLHHHSLSNPMSAGVQQPASSRPSIDRAHTFPTPPASASSVMGMPQQPGQYDSWSNAPVQGNQPLSIDTGLSNTRSVPTTPASTPPGKIIPGTAYPTPDSYPSSRTVYSAPSGQQARYPSQQMSFGAPLPSTYHKTDMPPPTKTGEFYSELASHSFISDQAKEEPDHEQDHEYTHATPYSANRSSYSYNPNAGGPPQAGEQVPNDLQTSPQQNGSDRATPRTATGAQPQWQSQYGAPQRSNTAPASNVYNVMEPRDTTNGAPDYYAAAPLSNGLSGQKRSRDDDDDADEVKRQKTGGADGGPVGGSPYNMSQPPIPARKR
jgi:protein SOK2